MTNLRKKHIVYIVALIGLLVFLYSIGALRPVERYLSRGLNPILSTIYSWGADINVAYDEQTSKVDLWQQINDLQAETNQLISENVELKVVEEENAILREYLNFFDDHGYEHILSRVISRGDITNVTGRTESILIDKGSADGLVIGLAVVDEQGIVVGKIAAVKESSSLVRLVNNRQCKLAASVLGNEVSNGVTEGELGLTIKMNFIPQEVEIKKDDIVVTSGLEETIPRGLVIGKVLEVNKENNELWQSAQITPLMDTNNLLIVSVIKP
ncbi:rod shape-determining protein MreC [Candidatus Parcubacteria bacterium]|nr:rod shape-determining protein MreC [Candidatus Parcubacteria bacterium]